MQSTTTAVDVGEEEKTWSPKVTSVEVRATGLQWESREKEEKSGGAKRPTDSWPGAFELLIFQFPPHIRENLHYGSLPVSTHPPLGLLCEVIAAVITGAPLANIRVRKCRRERVAGGGSVKVTQQDDPRYFHKFCLSLWCQSLLSIQIFQHKCELLFISALAVLSDHANIPLCLFFP